MRRASRIVFWGLGLYALAWFGYAVKSAAGVNLVASRHFGGEFPGSGRAIRWLQNHV